MKISRVTLYEALLPTRGGGYRRTTGFTKDATKSYVVRIDTDAGVSGFGEVAPVGVHYGPGWDGAVASGVPLLARMILGEDPLQIDRLNRQWDITFKEDLYVKAPVDTALWDIMGKVVNRPLCHVLGGFYPGDIPVYRTVHLFKEHDDTPETWAQRVDDYRDQGVRHFQIKGAATADKAIAVIEAVCDALQPGEMALCDANGGWSYADAVRICAGVRDLPIVIEQPCRTLEECIKLRPHCLNPMKLDESMTSTIDLLNAWNGGAVDYCTIKVARVGGLTKAMRMRDMCIDLGIGVVPDDGWGGEFVTSALTHLAWSVPAKYRLNVTDLTDYVTVSTGEGFVRPMNGYAGFTEGPGIGVSPKLDVLGDPIAVIE